MKKPPKTLVTKRFELKNLRQYIHKNYVSKTNIGTSKAYKVNPSYDKILKYIDKHKKYEQYYTIIIKEEIHRPTWQNNYEGNSLSILIERLPNART